MRQHTAAHQTSPMLGVHASYCAALVALLSAYWWLVRAPSTTTATPPTSAAFVAFQRKYLLVYLLVQGSDWLQGPYTYALYAHYGYDAASIALLFTIGFATAAAFGTFVGSAADRFGRRLVCLVFCVLYAASCMTKHSASFHVAAFGRVLSGIGSSILHSAFESWMVAAHHANADFKHEWLSTTFSLATTGNGLVAIAAGVLASSVHDAYGPVAPFDVSLVLLVLAAATIALTWGENFGSTCTSGGSFMGQALTVLASDRKILLLGLVQSCFESAMYIFVFLWTPSLKSTFVGTVPNGLVFSSFMVCVLFGSKTFGYLVRTGHRVESFTAAMLAVAGAALLLPALSTNHHVRLMAFFAFEACCGLYWPAMGTMRSRYIPEQVRATIMAVFRLPLNVLVTLVLNRISTMPESRAFTLVAAFLGAGALVQLSLLRISAMKPVVKHQ